jgi:hypothetical protein
MVIALNGLTEKAHKWYISHVYLVYKFRMLFDQQQATADSQEKIRIGFKLRHPEKKIEEHTVYGISLGLSREDIRNFNLAIAAEVKKGKSPKAIIQALIRENGRKH